MISWKSRKFHFGFIVGFFCLLNLSANDTINKGEHVLLSIDSTNEQLPDTVTRTNFGPEYEKYLDKADRAYRFGLFKKAKANYLKAAEINPHSLYIRYKIKEIENVKYNFSNRIFYFNFDKPEFLIISLTYLIVYFVVSLLIILIIILINRQRIERISKKKQTLLERYQELLVDFLFSNLETNSIPEEIKVIAASPFNRKILINQMIDLSINLTGEAKEKLQRLFILLNLDIDSIRKAHSKKWHVKVKGFHELAFMDIPGANNEISRCLQSRNDIVRMEAQLAMVRLNHEDPFGFLDQLEKPFTLWEQLTVYETIMFHNLPIPKFDRWLFSKNKSVVMFAIRMIDVFKQSETYENLFWMLVNEDEEIRRLSIQVIGNLKIKDALPHLKRLYKAETYDNCIVILQAIAKMPDETILSFLKLVLDKEDDVQLQIEAAIAINNAGEIGKNTLKNLMDSDYKNYQIIIKHVLDKRIT